MSFNWWGEPRVAGRLAPGERYHTENDVLRWQQRRADSRREAGKPDSPWLYPQWAAYRKSLPGLVRLSAPRWILHRWIWALRKWYRISSWVKQFLKRR